MPKSTQVAQNTKGPSNKSLRGVRKAAKLKAAASESMRSPSLFGSALVVEGSGGADAFKEDTSNLGE